MEAICLKTYDAPPISRREILRYAGVKGEVSAFDDLLDECLAEVEGKLIFKVCYRSFPVAREQDCLSLGFCKTASAALAKNLEGCTRVVVFAATVGIEIDRLIARYGALSPTKALFFQAIGAERIEALCDLFERELADTLAREGCLIRPRFSPGYGDFPLEAQRELFAVLDCPRKIGLSLNQSLLMSPSKSVTALVGVAEQHGA